MISQGAILSNRYLLQEELGAGGMSVVYKAVDLRTGAYVAVKIPHAFLLRDTQYVDRLKREAQIAATLQSSRIAIVTDVSEHEGTPYFVMEYVPGETLGDLITRQGAIAPTEALRIILDVARAMDAAHERGVVHRDIKPHNVRLTRDGDVKVLDFGIARMEGRGAITSASLFLGTPDYCAPERAEGPGDIRSDVYSIGIVLYEMLCGKLPFKGNTPWTTIQMHASEPPPPLPAELPPAVVAIAERCLAKRPEDRYQTPAELVQAVQGTLRSLEREGAGTAPPGAFAQTEMLRTPAMDDAPPAMDATVISEPAAADQPEPLARTMLAVPTSVSTGPIPPPPVDVEPAPPPPVPPAPLPPLPSKGGRGPLIPILAGAGALVVAAAVVLFVVLGSGGGGSDNGGTDGKVVVDPSVTVSETPTGPLGENDVVIVQPESGATVAGPVTVQVDPRGANLKAPAEADPAGRHLHYLIDVDPATILSPGQPIPTGQNPNIIHTASAVHSFLDVSPGEHTVYVVQTGNDHVPLSPQQIAKLKVTSAKDALAGARSGESAPIVYQALVDGKWRIFTMDGNGANRRRLTSANANDYRPAISPDGSRIAFESDRDGSGNIYTMNLDGSDVKRVTTGSAKNTNPAWSPDGENIVFVSDRDGREHLWIVSSGGGDPRQVTRGPQNDGVPSWALDGSRIAYQSDAGGGVTHVFTVDPRGGTPKQLTDGPSRDNRPVWSPDAKQIAFSSFRDNRWNIFVMNADGSNQRKLTDGRVQDLNPSWAPDGKLLLFNSDRDNNIHQIFQVPVEGGAAKRLTDGTTLSQWASWPLK